jgi:predicted RNA-binding protein with PIN domain
MKAESILLEPYFSFRIELPTENVGRAMSDIQQRSGEFSPPETQDDMCSLTGFAPVSEMMNYASELGAYTKGRGRIFLTQDGYRPCHNSENVINSLAYDPQADIENTPDSVFCSHGAGHNVKWSEVEQYMHVESPLKDSAAPVPEPERAVIRRSVMYSGSLEEDKELQRIFERTYGPVRGCFIPPREAAIKSTAELLDKIDIADEYLLVDGYNVIFAWDELRELARDNLDLARQTLINILVNYQGFRRNNVILVFDAYRVALGSEHIEKHGGVYVVFTRQAEIADTYIEKVTSQLGRRYNVRVVTSDGLEQCIVLGHGALRVPARIFHQEVLSTSKEIEEIIKKLNRSAGKK